jgi:hypothetical protein
MAMRKSKPKFRVGDHIQFIFMSSPVRGRVVEDRGAIGIAGSHLYRVVGNAGGVTRVLELPAEQLQRIDGSIEKITESRVTMTGQTQAALRRSRAERGRG